MAAHQACHAAPGAPPQPPLWEHFVVVGLAAAKPLQTVQGEPGFLGTDQKYKPDFVDCLPHSKDGIRTAKPPPQLPLCCLPTGVDIVLHQDLGAANLVPHTYACVLTEGDGTKVYASCLSFYDRVPHVLCTKHEHLLGAVALKAICLLSHQPYLATADKVLRELYHIAFVHGSTVPLPDIANSLLSVPCPQLDGPQVCVNLGRSQCVMWPPLAIGPPPGEMSLRPLLEVLQPDNLVGLFAAVLLEQRVLLWSRHHWLLTVAAEGVVRLLHPLKYQHVYIPVMPVSLTDYLEAPTPFLMGLHSSEYVEPRTLDLLVVVDLDADTLSPCKSDTLLQRCLNHPYMLQLKNRVRMLMQPSVTDVDAVGQQQDPWMLAAQQLSGRAWGSCKQALLVRIFMQFFCSVLDSYQKFLVAGSTNGSRSSTHRALSGVHGLLSMQMRVSGAGPAGAAALPSVPVIRSAALSSAMLSPMQQQCRVDMAAVLEHHHPFCGCSDPALLQQVMQGLPFLSFIEEYNSLCDSQDWLKKAEDALCAWRTAEEALPAAETGQQLGGSSIERVTIAPHRPSPLMPPGGLVYSSFPALILVEHGDGQGLRLRRTSNNSKKRQSVGRRRAISELMGSQIDLRRKSPVQGSINTEVVPAQRPIRTNGVDTSPVPAAVGGGVGSATLPLPVGPNPVASRNTTSMCGSGFSLELGEYSAEADVVRRQTGLLVQLMQSAASTNYVGEAWGSDAMTQEDLEAARLLLCMQTGGNGWFLVSRLKELITTGAAASTSINTCSTSTFTAAVGKEGGSKSNSCSPPKGAHMVSFSSMPGGTCAPMDDNNSGSLALPSLPVAPGAPTASSRPGSSTSNGCKPPSPSRSNKLFGSRAASPPQALKVSHSMESFANAAQAVASAFSASVLNRSASKGKSGGSRSSSPDVYTPAQAPSAPSSTRVTREDILVYGSGCASKTASVASTHCRGSAEGSTTGFAMGSGSSSPAKEAATAAAALSAAAPVSAAADVAHHDSACADDQQHPAINGGSSSTSKAGCWWERCVSLAAFGVLADMVNSIIEVASVQDDFRVVLAALELSCLITCQPTLGPKQTLLSCLGSNPAVHVEWFWSCTFSFAVSSSYLQAEELADIRDVVAVMLAEFARYITGVGIPGTTAWLLLMQLAAEHLGNSAPLHPEVLLSLRAHVAHMDSTAYHERLGLPGPMPPPSIQHGSNASYPRAAGTLAAVAKQLPANVLSALRVCGLDVGGVSAPAARTSLCRPSDLPTTGNAATTAAGTVATAGGVWRLSQANSSSKLAAMEWEEQGGAGQPAASGRDGDTGCGCTYKLALSNPAAAHTADREADEPLLASAMGPAVVATPGSDCDCRIVHIIPAPIQQQQQQHEGQSPQTAAATTTAPTSHRQVGSAATSGPGKLACVVQDASSRAVAEQGVVGSSNSSSSPFSVESPRSPRSPRGHAGSKPLSPGRLSRLSPRDVQQQHRRSISSPRSCSMRSSYAFGSKAATTDDVAAPSPPKGPVAPGMRVEMDGGSLLQQGALQWAAVHSKPVVSVDASSYTVLSVSIDRSLKVLDTSEGTMRLAASMSLPSLQGGTCSWAAGYAAMPVVKLWRDGHRAAVGNARQHAVWILDLQGSAASVELTGLGSAVSTMHVLERNHDALLTGLSSATRSHCSQGKDAAVCLWDLRRPGKPAASLDFEPTATAGGSAVPVSDGIKDSSSCTVCSADAGSPGRPGVLSLTVHSDGVLAAAGCKDGTAVAWDMRQPSKPLAICAGHQGPVTQALFLPAAAASMSDSGSSPALQPSMPVPILLTAGDDWTVRLWDAAAGSCRATCVGHGGAVTAVQVASSKHSSRIISGAADGSVGVWSLRGELCRLVQQHWAPVQVLAQGDDAFVSGACDKTCCIWSLSELLTCSMHQPPQAVRSQERQALVSSMAFDPVAELLCSGHRDGLVSVWNCSMDGASQAAA